VSVVPDGWPLILAATAAGVAYAVGIRRLRAAGSRWSPARSLAFTGGLVTLAAALASPLAAHDDDVRVHMVQHLLLGMLGPLLLALSAPVTLALRTVPRPVRAGLVRVLHLRVVKIAAHPVVAAGAFLAGMAALWFTPLYGSSPAHPLVHELLHLHVLASGCLLAWVFAGSDPVPRTGSMGLRTTALLVAMGGHAAMAKLLAAGYGDLAGAGVGERQQAAELLYYGGDLFDGLLLVAFFSRWYAAEGRRLRFERRAAAVGA
jgi:putative membrane protein